MGKTSLLKLLRARALAWVLAAILAFGQGFGGLVPVAGATDGGGAFLWNDPDLCLSAAQDDTRPTTPAPAAQHRDSCVFHCLFGSPALPAPFAVQSRAEMAEQTLAKIPESDRAASPLWRSLSNSRAPPIS